MCHWQEERSNPLEVEQLYVQGIASFLAMTISKN